MQWRKMKNGASLDHSCFIIFNSFTRHTQKKKNQDPLRLFFKKYISPLSLVNIWQSVVLRGRGGGGEDVA